MHLLFDSDRIGNQGRFNVGHDGGFYILSLHRIGRCKGTGRDNHNKHNNGQQVDKFWMKHELLLKSWCDFRKRSSVGRGKR
jgi:hypothetical protein